MEIIIRCETYSYNSGFGNVSATDNECYNYIDNWSFTAHWLKVTTETSPFVKSDNSEELIG